MRLAAGLASVFLSAHIDEVRVTLYYSLVLLVGLESFTATVVDDKVKLNWVTTEKNIIYFLVQRNGLTIDSGKAGDKKNYEVIDGDPHALNHYRVVEVNHDGRKFYSKTVTARSASRSVSVYPNLVGRELFIKYGGELQSVQVTDINGKAIMVIEHKVNKGLYKLALSELAAGVYSIRLMIDGQSYQRVFLK